MKLGTGRKPIRGRRLVARRVAKLLNCKLNALVRAIAVTWEKGYLALMTEEETAKYLSGQMTPQKRYEIYWRGQNPPPLPEAEQVPVPEIAPAELASSK